MIFHQLRLIHSKHFIRDYFTGLTLEIIIKWLQVGVSEYNKPLRLKFRFVSRDLVPSDRATCTIASRVNFSNAKKLSLFDFEVQNLRVSLHLYYHLHNVLVIIDGLDERHDKGMTPFRYDHYSLPLRFSMGVGQILMPVLMRNLSIQSLGGSFWTKRLIPDLYCIPEIVAERRKPRQILSWDLYLSLFDNRK